jgi:hypothetical protein
VFKGSWFTKFADKKGIKDDELRGIVKSLEQGQIDAELGGSVYKQRLARSGKGKSGGYRTILYYKSEFRAFFAFGFAKSDMDNIDERELRVFKDRAKDFFALTDEQIKQRQLQGSLQEIDLEVENEEDIQKRSASCATRRRSR